MKRITATGILLFFITIRIVYAQLPFPCTSEQPPSKVPMGANIDGIVDWSLTNAFVDMMKQSRGFYQVCAGCAFGTPAPLDATGWPTTDFEVIFQSFFDGTASTYNGTYSISFTGSANIAGCCEFTFTNVVYDAASNTTTANLNLNLTEPASGKYFILNFRNTRRTPGSPANSGLTNLRLIRPGYPASTSQTFTNSFLDHIDRFSVLRYMDWANTNNSDVETWAERTLPAMPSQSASQITENGVAWEYCIELANLTGKDMWVNIPHKADDDYVLQLATLLRDNVDENINIYVEYSNEVWNWGFSQSHWNRDTAVAEVNAGGSDLNNDGENNPPHLGARRIARRTMEISNIFRSVWGNEAINTRIRPVYCYQVVWPGLWLDPALKWLNDTYGNPSDYMYAIAGAPYFHVSDDVPGLSSDDILDRLDNSMNALFTHMDNLLIFDHAASVARWYGLKFLCYEGGPDTFGPNNIQAKSDATMNARMQQITENYLRKWYSYGSSGLFNWFVAGATNYATQYGTWGLTNNMDNQSSPKILGVDNILNSPVPDVQAGHRVATTGTSTLDTRLFVNDRYYATYPANWATLNPYNRYLDGGAYNDYLIRVDESGNYNLSVNYNCWVDGARLQVWLNNRLVETINMPRTTTGIENFQDSDTIFLTLPEGLNTIRLVYDFTGRAYDTRQLKFEYAGECELPVELISFDATLMNNGMVDLSWITANEIKSDYFMVEKSADGNTFESFKRVECQKKSSASYRTSDETPYVGSTYYRLKQIDENGSYKYSEIKSVNLKPFDITTIFPVPAKDQISFAFQSSEDKEVWIHIMDVTGKKVYSRQAHIQKGVSVVEIDLPSVQSAMYLLQVYDPLSNVQSSKDFYISN